MDLNLGGDTRVVSLLQYQNDTRFPAISSLSTYWTSIRGNRAVPLRSDVDPRAIESSLEFAFILERIAPGVARFRLAGMHLNELMGMEVRGMPLTSFFVPSARSGLSQALETVFSNPATAVFSLNGDRGIGKPAIEAQMVLLPLKSDFGDVSRCLGGLVSTGPVGRAPRRFTISDTLLRPVLTEGPLPVEDTTPPVAENGLGMPVQTSTPGMAEEGTPFAAAPKRPTERPKLYVIKGDVD